MPQPVCRRCRQPLTPVYADQDEHPLCSPTDTGWIPQPGKDHQTELPAAEPDPQPARPRGLTVALALAARGWHILPLTTAGKRPLGNCPACRDTSGALPHRIEDCPCILAGRWCHGVRAATTGPHRLTAWWRDEPAAVPASPPGPPGWC
jgi:Bifunctional DNA primase/polymerase, N-terminal